AAGLRRGAAPAAGAVHRHRRPVPAAGGRAEPGRAAGRGGAGLGAWAVRPARGGRHGGAARLPVGGAPDAAYRPIGTGGTMTSIAPSAPPSATRPPTRRPARRLRRRGPLLAGP